MANDLASIAVSGFFALLCLTCQSKREPSPPTTQPSGKPLPLALQVAAVDEKIPELAVQALPAGFQITIDGKLDELAWQHAASTGDFVNVGNGAKAVDQTLGGHALLTWTERYLFIAVVIRDTDVRGNFAPESSDPHLWTQNTAEIMIDPDGDGDNRDYYEMQIGPQNLVFDSQFDDYNQPRVLPDGPFGHQDWTAHARTAVSVRGTMNQPDDRDDGYTVEAQIPWSSFGKAKTVPPRPGDHWRMNFYAMRNNGGLAWSPILGKGNFHKASRFGRVTWVGAIAARH